MPPFVHRGKLTLHGRGKLGQMKRATAEADHIAMAGGYSLATRGAKHVIDHALPRMRAAIEALPLAEHRPFVMSDMGTADGGTSLSMVADALGIARARQPARSLWMVYSDQQGNDYNALAGNVYGEASPLSAIADCHVTMSATSFYRQILPAGSLDLGFSATAMHWLSRKPADISDHIHMTGASGLELAAFRDQGHRDWRTILLHRATELAPGGRLVLVNFGKDEEGRYLGNTQGVCMFDTFNALWQRFLDAGQISADEYRAMTLPQYYNTVEEFSAPLTDPAEPAYQAGLRLESIETRVTPCPYRLAFEDHGDASRFAREYIPTLRSWTQSTFYGALSPTRTVDERRALIEAYYFDYERMVRKAPSGHGMDYVHIYMTVRKDG